MVKFTPLPIMHSSNENIVLHKKSLQNNSSLFSWHLQMEIIKQNKEY